MLDVAHEDNEALFALTEEQIAQLKERERKLENGESRLVPWKEVDQKIRAKYGF